MEFIATTFPDVWLIQPDVFSDSRGFFLESYTYERFAEKGITCHFVQDNHSRSMCRGVVRGLHYQRPPCEQAKLVRVIRGAVFDVVVDMRKNSPAFGAWEGFTLSESNFRILYIPHGFAHGFCTLEPETEIIYKVDRYYSPGHEGGIVWNDSTLAIGWPVTEPVLSEKDRMLPPFDPGASPFIASIKD